MSIAPGSVYWAAIGKTAGESVAVMVLSNESFNASTLTVIALSCTSQHRPTPLYVCIGTFNGCQFWAKANQVRTIAVERLRAKLGHASSEVVSTCVHQLQRLLKP